MYYLHNVSGILTLDINILTLIQRKTSSVLNMWLGFASTIKNIIYSKVTNRVVSNIICLVQNDNESRCNVLGFSALHQ
jgi:hypothetical protein